jgi:hypothetical protein
MKFWLYAIDWRSMAIEILGEYASDIRAQAEAKEYLKELPDEHREDFLIYKTIGVTPVSPEMQSAVDQFKRFNGRVA